MSPGLQLCVAAGPLGGEGLGKHWIASLGRGQSRTSGALAGREVPGTYRLTLTLLHQQLLSLQLLTSPGPGRGTEVAGFSP